MITVNVTERFFRRGEMQIFYYIYITTLSLAVQCRLFGLVLSVARNDGSGTERKGRDRSHSYGPRRKESPAHLRGGRCRRCSLFWVLPFFVHGAAGFQQTLDEIKIANLLLCSCFGGFFRLERNCCLP